MKLYDQKAYLKKLDEFNNKIGTFEKGQASLIITDLILSLL